MSFVEDREEQHILFRPPRAFITHAILNCRWVTIACEQTVADNPWLKSQTPRVFFRKISQNSMDNCVGHPLTSIQRTEVLTVNAIIRELQPSIILLHRGIVGEENIVLEILGRNCGDVACKNHLRFRSAQILTEIYVIMCRWMLSSQ